MDIYDRTNWPLPTENPLVQMLTASQEWFSNEEIVGALGLSLGRALLSKGTIFSRQIQDDDAAIVARGWLTPGKAVNRAHGGSMRVFNKRALVIAAMRTETVNAAAFRDWLATESANAFEAG